MSRARRRPMAYTADEYEKLALEFAHRIPDYNRLAHGCHALAAGVGAVNVHYQRVIEGEEPSAAYVAKHLGRILWTLVEIADAMGIGFNNLMRLSLDDLNKRAKEGPSNSPIDEAWNFLPPSRIPYRARTIERAG
jgi:hypothetical protein